MPRPPARLRIGSLGLGLVLLFAAVPSARAGLFGLDESPSLAANQPIVFSVTGDAPYGDSEIPIFQQHLADHNKYSPSEFYVHVGDIFTGGTPCDEFRYQQMADMLEILSVPAFIIPGDNETTDCTDPSQAWGFWLAHLLGLEDRFCGTPAVQRQSDRPENFAFTRSGVLFMGINLVASGNTSSLMLDDADWVAEQLQAQGAGVRAAVLFSQAGPGSGRSLFFDAFVTAAGAFGKPVLLVHGDGHSFIYDKPFAAQNITRVQVDRGDEPPLQITVSLSTTNPWQLLQDPWPVGAPILNMPPCVEAGLNRSFPGPGTFTLVGTATDDGDPSGALGLQWSLVSGPAAVGFGSPSAASTTASFPGTGSYVLRLTATDGALSSSDDVSIAVGTSSNMPPDAVNDAYAVDEDVTLSIPAPGVLDNDTDPDGDPLTASVSSWPLHGTLTLNASGSFSYRAAATYNGGDSFSYRVADALGSTDIAAVTLTIRPVNDLPMAAADEYNTGIGAKLEIAAPGVLDNDSDVEGDALTVALVQPPAYGTLALAPNGSFAYTPALNFAGYDHWSYMAADSAATSAPTQVTIGVGVVKFAPIADATVRSQQSTRNLGSEADLVVKEAAKPYYAYLKFQVSGIEAVQRAFLRLHVDSGSDGGSVFLVANTYAGTSTSWLENGITWDNAPPMPATPLGSWVVSPAGGPSGSSDWVEVDVTKNVPGDGIFSFGLRLPAAGQVTFSAKEGASPPELVLIAAVPPRPKPPQTQECAGSFPAKLGAEPARDALLGLRAEAGGTRLDYELASPAGVVATVFDVRGRRARVLLDVTQAAGRHTLLWDGRSDAGARLGTGVYFLRLQLGPQHFTRKFLVQH